MTIPYQSPAPTHPPVHQDCRRAAGRYPRIVDIQRIVAAAYGVSVKDMLSSRRAASVVRPRHMAICLSKELTLHSLQVIGRLFGNRDHTTVSYAVRRVEALRDANPAVADEFGALRTRIEEAAT